MEKKIIELENKIQQGMMRINILKNQVDYLIKEFRKLKEGHDLK